MDEKEMQEKILQLTEENQNLKTERDTLSSENEKLKKDNEDVRALNQKYFNKLIAQDSSKDDKKSDDEKTVPSCEDFAKTLKIIN